ncbi:hypothetical protein Gotri_010583 [Gossypium trilobum]|uniref:Uncharacterized protein n=1 Tax=Gossypium trilobum TaxID=34281 RepID=A0A7J9EQW5_9ROSI|nr:hypothetical protein [Gossypium trilobum]
MFEWDDSAGLTAFQEAKQRFWEIYHGFPCENKLPRLFSEIKSLIDNAKEMDWFSIPLEEIQATR